MRLKKMSNHKLKMKYNLKSKLITTKLRPDGNQEREKSTYNATIANNHVFQIIQIGSYITDFIGT